MNYKGFHQLQWEDRLVIEKMLKVGDSKAKIAEALGVCKKTIYNEIKRGWTQQMTSDYEFIWCYCPEMDSVMGTVGSSRALVVLTERLTRAGIILPVPDHTAASVVRALNGLERRLGKDFYPMFQSITVDNGCEFQDYDGMEKACRRKGKRTTVYYCHPHAPHERGSNENMNRIIRRFFPKGTNFDEVPISEIRRAEEWMNNYPREVLGWQTAATLLRSYMSAC